jgi:hypothetical protein
MRNTRKNQVRANVLLLTFSDNNGFDLHETLPGWLYWAAISQYIGCSEFADLTEERRWAAPVGFPAGRFPPGGAAARTDSMRLLALTESPDFVCYRYRWAAFRDALAERGWQVDDLPLARTAVGFLRQLPRIAAADVVVLQRRLLGWWKRRLLRAAAKVLIYDFDDAMFCRDSNRRKPPESRHRRRQFRDTVRMADACLAGNEYLRQQAAACAAPGRVHRFPTCVAPRRYPVAEHGSEGRPVQLVWIGSRATLPALVDAQAGLRAAAACLPELELKIICDVFPRLDGVRIVPTAWSAATEAREIAAAQIGIAWMPDHPWSLGKCGLKVLQYMAAGLPVVANPVGVHRELIVQGRTGFLAATPDEWREAIRTLARSPELRRRMGRAARERVVAHYSVDHWGPRLAAVLDALRGRLDLANGQELPAMACERIGGNHELAEQRMAGPCLDRVPP